MQVFSWSPVGVAVAASLLAALSPRQESGDEARARVVELAERYATVRWKAEERHVFHGEDARGVQVDTPDAGFVEGGWRVGEENVGMPYAWGGFTSLGGLEGELGEERYAGHVPVSGRAWGSRETVGLDCSGLVSRCWSLPVKHSTRNLGALSYELEDYAELLPGDIVNAFDAHTAIFTGWADEARTTMNVIEAARLRVEASTYTVEALRSGKFRPMRYKPLDPRWQAMPGSRPAGRVHFHRRGEGSFVSDGSEPRDLRTDPLPDAFRGGEIEPGGWVRYQAFESLLPSGSGVWECTWMAVRGPPGKLELQRRLALDDQALSAGESFACEAPWAEVLAGFASFPNPFRNLKVSEASIVEGTFHASGKEVPARRLRAVLEGHSLSRSTLYPVKLDVDCVLSDEVPLLGLCEGRFDLSIDQGDYGVGRLIHTYWVKDFGR